MTITVDQIKTLREETGAGIMDVRKALTESDGDTKKAKAWLEKKGMKRAAEKSDRSTEAGYVFSSIIYKKSLFRGTSFQIFDHKGHE